MRQSARLLSFFFLIAMLLQSCSTVDDRPTSNVLDSPEQSTQWTVLFYGTDHYGSADAPGSVMKAVESLQNVPLLDGVRIMACVSAPETGGSVHVYRMQGAGVEMNGSDTETPEDWGTMAISAPQTLTNFIEHAVRVYPAEKYALILAGEGQGWQGSLTDNVHGNGQPMSLTELRQAVASVNVHNNPIHFDVLAWFAPEMSTVEAAYECASFADYLTACPYASPHDFELSIPYWMFDLNAIPEMDGERLAKTLVDGMMEGLRRETEPVHYSVLRLADAAATAQELDSLATALSPHATDYTPEIQALRDAAWVPATDDSQAVDLGRLAIAAQNDTLFAQDPNVAEAAAHLETAIDQMVIYDRTTLDSEDRHGVTLYFPEVLDTTVLAAYDNLSLSFDHTGWSALLHTISTTAPTLTLVSGTVRWSGHVLENIHIFLNTAQFGAPNISLVKNAALVEIITQDYARYETTFALESDSVQCYLGLFQDLDMSGTLSTGDRYGYWHQNAQPPRDWILLHNGDELEDINVELDRTF